MSKLDSMTAKELSLPLTRFDIREVARIFQIPVRFICSPDFPVNEGLFDEYVRMLLWELEGGWRGLRRPDEV